MDYGMRTTVPLPFEAARVGIEAALKEEGFGILTEIDVRATLAEKIGVEFERYTILGACNPALAHRGLTAEKELGLLLPCNVIIYEGAFSGGEDAGAHGAHRNDGVDAQGNGGAGGEGDGDGSYGGAAVSTTVAIFDPEAGLQMAGNPALDELAREAKGRLARALAAFAANTATGAGAADSETPVRL